MRRGTIELVNHPPRLDLATARAVLCGFALGAASARGLYAADASVPALTNFQQVIALSRAEAMDNAQPVRVRGVVAFPAHGPRDLFHIHDGTNGVGVTPLSVAGLRKALSSQPQVGQLVEVEGETSFGSSHPFVGRATVRVLGPGRFPEPRVARAKELAGGRYHGDIVKLRATVLDVSRVRGHAILLVHADGHGFYADLSAPPDHLPVEWLSANVELQGMPWLQFDGAGKVTSFQLLVGSNAWVRVIKPGPSDLYAGPRRTLREVAEAPVADDRIAVSGTVMHSSALGFFTLQDATGVAFAYALTPMSKSSREGEYIERPPRPVLQPGDRVEVVASKSSRRAYAPQLNGAECRVIGHEALPTPPLITDTVALSGEHDCRRVRIQGRVVDRDSYSQGEAKVSRLWVKFGDLTSYAVHAGSNHVEFPIPTGSMVELTGLCVVDAGTDRPVRRFSIYIDSPADVRLLPEPPVWMSATVLRAGGLAGGVLVLVLGWVLLLRRQVARQTKQLRASNERLAGEARERERAEAEIRRALELERELGELKTNFVSMVSHEFRTPLEVIVSSTDILDRYLDRLPAPERAEHLGAIQDSVKRMSGMMEDVLLLGRFESERQQFRPDDLHLTACCRRLVDEMRSATGDRCPIQFSLVDDVPLARADESLLRHILTNLLSNAVKYSPAGSPVRLSLARDGADAVFCIEDNGLGIPAADQTHLFEAFHRGRNAGQISGTGLGLVIVKRSVELHGGRIEFTSAEGKGTQFTVRLPVFSASEP
jgi:signal transduction histidine kinase